MQTILIKKKHCLLTTFDCRMLSCALFSRVNVIKTEKKIKKKDGTSDKKSEEKTESTKKSEPSKETKVVPSSPKAKKVLASYFVV